MPLSYLQVELSETFYLKNPSSSELGKKIVAGALELLNAKGYLNFTLKELAASIGSTEASVYRYFVDKGQLITYCTGMYWALLKHRMEMYTLNITDPQLYRDRVMDVLLNDIKDEQYLAMAYNDFSKFRTLACKHTILVLGMINQTQERNQLAKDYESILSQAYRFVEHMVKKLHPESNSKDLIANAIMSSTHISETTVNFLIDNMSELLPLTNQRIRDFVKTLIP